jgi:FkbM family methyltransferase
MKKVISLQIQRSNVVNELKILLDPSLYTQKILCDYFENRQLYEPNTSQILIRHLREGDIFVDIGSHIGYFTLLAASLVGEKGNVLAFEPEPINYNLLLENIKLNGLQNVTSYNVALGSEEKQTQFFQANPELANDGGHALWDIARCLEDNQNPEYVAEFRKCIQVTLKRLENCLPNNLPNIRMIKIDVEGAEMAVLQGSDRILRAGVPYIICEIHDFALSQMGSNQFELRRYMYDLGYKSYAISPTGDFQLIEISEGETYKSTCIYNMLFVNHNLI